MSAIIISAILIVLVYTVGTSSFFARFDALNGEFKRTTLGLAESCINVALLGLATSTTPTTYNPAGHVVELGTDSYGRPMSCTIENISDPGSKTRTISAFSEFQGTFSNVAVAATIQDPTAYNRGAVFVVTHVQNDNGGTKGAGNFTMRVTGANPSQTQFNGDEDGVMISVDAGTSFNVTEDPDTSYTETLDTNTQCSGTVNAGQTVTCRYLNYDKLTTGALTLTANITNGYGGSLTPAGVAFTLDGSAVVSGATTNSLSPTTHTFTAPTIPGYHNSTSWGGDAACSGTAGSGSIVLNAGDNRTCTVSYTQDAPSAPICADTVMMMDRTGSMTTTDISNEKFAATSLLGASLYGKLSPHPNVGAGIFGDPNDHSGSDLAAIVGHLTTDYVSLSSSINAALGNGKGQNGTNLQSAIATAHTELKGLNDGMKKVLILISDGETNESIPVVTTNDGSTAANVPTKNDGNNWTNPAGAYDGTTATDNGGHKEQYYNFGISSTGGWWGSNSSLGIPSGSTITGIEVDPEAWLTDPPPTNGSPVTDYPTSIVQDNPSWVLTTSGTSNTKAKAVADSNDNSYITASSNGAAQAFLVSGSGIPGNATQISVTVNVWAKRSTASNTSAAIKIGMQNGASSDYQTPDGGSGTLNSNFANYSRVLNTNPLTNHVWTVNDNTPNDVNHWVQQFGIQKFSGNGSARVSQISVVVTYMVPTTPSTTCQLGVEISKGGATFTPTQTQLKQFITSSKTTPKFGGMGVTWGTAWSSSDFDYTAPSWWSSGSDSNFRIRVQDLNPGAGCNPNAVTNIDKIGLIVYYTTTTSSSPDPTQAAKDAATLAKSEGTEIFSVRYSQDTNSAGISLLQNVASPDTSVATIVPNGASRSGTTATVTTTSGHNLVVGQTVKISGVSNSVFNGTFLVVSVPTPTTFTYTTPSSGTATGSGGNIYYPHYFTSPTTQSQMAGVFATIGAIVCPAVNAPPPAPPPTTGTLMVVTNMVNNSGKSKASNAFNQHVTGANATPASFTGVDSPGKLITLTPGAGTFTVSEDSDTDYGETFGGQCINQSILAGQILTCTITNDDQPAPPPPLPLPPPNINIGSWQEKPK